MPIIGVSPVLSSPSEILGPSLTWWVRADRGITLATGVSQWSDITANGINFAQATAGKQPAFVQRAINGRPAVRGDGVDDNLAVAFPRTSPASQPFYVWAVFLPIAHVNFTGIMGDYNVPAASGFLVRQSTPGTNYQALDSTSGPKASTPVGSWARMEAFFCDNNLPGGDYLKIGSSQASGVSASNTPGGGTMNLFSSSGTTDSSSIMIAEALYFNGQPTPYQRFLLDNYCNLLYGPGLT